MTQTYFIDFEASSLDSGSFPIEIAWVDQAGQGESHLIRPEPFWTNWSAQSERLHGISREMLYQEGKPADWVAHRVVTVLSDAILISDNPAFDSVWMAVLLESIYVKSTLVMAEFDGLIGEQIKRMMNLITPVSDHLSFWHQRRVLLDEGKILAMQTVETCKLMPRTQHRALADAMHLWQCWHAVRQAIDRRLSRS